MLFIIAILCIIYNNALNGQNNIIQATLYNNHKHDLHYMNHTLTGINLYNNLNIIRSMHKQKFYFIDTRAYPYLISGYYNYKLMNETVMITFHSNILWDAEWYGITQGCTYTGTIYLIDIGIVDYYIV